MQITGGEIQFSRTVRPADYESKSATVKATFVLDQGEDFDQVAAELGRKVQAKCLELVGLKVKS